MKVRVRRKNRHKKITDKYSTIINSEYEKRGHYFVKNKDGTPRKKAGRPKTDTEKAIKSAKATISRKQRNIQKLEQKLNNAKSSFKKQKETSLHAAWLG